MHVLIYTKGTTQKIDYIDFDDIVKFTGMSIRLKRQAHNYLRFDNGTVCSFEPDTIYRKEYAGSEKICFEMTPYQAFLFMTELLNINAKSSTDCAFDFLASNFWFWSIDEEEDELQEIRNEYKSFRLFCEEYYKALIKANIKGT